MAGRNFSSLDEANAFLRVFHERRNAEPKADFMGLSSNQIAGLLGELPALEPGILRVKTGFPAEFLDGIPVVADARFFLGLLAEAEPLKATATGNLPRAFALRLFEQVERSEFKKFIRLRSEKDSMAVESLRRLLELAGWIRKVKGSFRLSRRGSSVLEAGLSPAQFGELFHVFANRFNWSYQDGYEEFAILQRAWPFSLYILHKKARQKIDSHSVSPHFVRAFPGILAEVRSAWRSVFATVDGCFVLRFLERCCAHFGLIEIIEQAERSGHTFNFRVSPLFDRFLAWEFNPPLRARVH
jgi:hypothetical protein